MDHLCYFCLVLLCFHALLFVDALWSPAEKGLTSWLLFVMSIVTLSLLGQVWCLIVSIPDLCPFSYFNIIICVFQINILLRDMKQESQFDKVFSKFLQSFQTFRSIV